MNNKKIPLYFDDPNDLYKFNGIDEKLNHYLYEKNQPFLDNIPSCIQNSIKTVTVSFSYIYYYPIYASYQWYYECNISKILILIPKNVLEDIRNNKCKILIFNIYEGYALEHIENLIKEKIIDVYNLNYNNFVTLTGNCDEKSPNGIKNIYFNSFENIIEFYMSNIDYFFEKVKNNLYSSELKKYKFICLQRRPKVQRLMLFSELYEYKNDGVLTMGIGDYAKNFSNINCIENYFFNVETFQKYKNLQLKNQLPYQFDVSLSTENPVEDLNVKKYFESYLHIVSETYFETHKNQLFFSEKIYKPIVFLQPFIIFGQPRSLHKLQQLGFKTFSSQYINEDYDNIIDDRERFLAALHQVKKVIAMSHRELHRMMEHFRESLIYNYYLLKNRNDNSEKRLLLDLHDHLNNW